MAFPNLDHTNHVGLTFARVGDELRGTVTVPPGEDGVGVPPGGATGQVLTKLGASDYDTDWATPPAGTLEAVAGGAGFAPVSGVVTLDLANARVFLHEMVGNMVSLSFANAPDPNAYGPAWTWVLRVNATGGYSLPTAGNRPAVTFVDGQSFDDADLSPNAVNEFVFWQAGAETRGMLVSNGRLELPAREICFLANQTILVPMLRAETLDPANAVKTGDGVITYAKNGTPITGAPLPATAFIAGDVLGVTCAGLTATTAVSIPRYV